MKTSPTYNLFASFVALIIALGASLSASANITVTSLDDIGPGSLRQAIADATAGETIEFAVAGTITLTSGQLMIDKDLTITGPGADILSLSGNGSQRVLRVEQCTIVMSGLRITGGQTLSTEEHGGSGILNFGNTTISGVMIDNNRIQRVNNVPGKGGGVENLGTMMVSNSIMRQNSCDTAYGEGGAVFNSGELTIIGSIIEDNLGTYGSALANSSGGTTLMTGCTVADNRGAGLGSILNKGTLTAALSTISGNKNMVVGGQGAGIYNSSTASLILNGCTVVFNMTGLSGGGIHVESGGNALVRNTIIAGNWAEYGPDCYGTLQSGDYNLIQAINGYTMTGDTTHNLYGVDPLLGPLSDNGGPTMTHALLPGSPAIDHGSAGGLSTDQRGQPRVFNFPAYSNADDGCDIGAYELQERAQEGPLFVVNSNDDTNDGVPGIAHCSLREAINAANANPDANTIEFAAEVQGVHTGVNGTIILSGGKLPVVGELTLSGPGASNLTISGDYSTRILDVAAGAVVAVSGLTIAEGVAYDGGGIRNLGNLTLEGCTITDCSSGYGISFGYGGGIASIGVLSLNNCTIAGCSSFAGGAICDAVNSGQTSPDSRIMVNYTTISGNQGYQGSAIHNGAGECTVTNCTVSGNQGGHAGAALLNQATMTIANSTVCNNSSGWWGAGVASVPWASGPTTVSNCIIAGNVADGAERDVESYDGDIVSGDHNLIRNNEGVFITGVTTHNLYSVDPMLGPLSDNGGPTLTHALLPGSPAIDHGSAGGLATDQRGQPRVFNFPAYPDAVDGCDIGAYELQERAQEGPLFVVNTNDDTNDGVPGIAHCSLREAINAANANPDANTIEFAEEVPGVHTGVTGTITLSRGQLLIDEELTISGPGASDLTISGNAASRIFSVTSKGSGSISGVTIADGGNVTNGGGIENRGRLALSNCIIADCATRYSGGPGYGTGYGGGISNLGDLDITNSQIRGCAALAGGGICDADGAGNPSAESRITISNSTISGNKAYQGAGINNFRGECNLTQCTVSGNEGGYAGAALMNLAVMNLASSTICQNTSGKWGAGIASNGYSHAATSLSNCIVAGNLAAGEYSDVYSFGWTVVSGDYNLIGNIDGCTITGATTHNLYGMDPLLGPLSDNGGPTLTHALLPGSPAIDHGSAGGLATDQRGQPRVFNFPAYPNSDDGCDIGANELQERAQEVPLFVVNTNDDTDDSVPGIAHCSLREAINAANANSDANRIEFASEVPGVYTGVTGTITLASGALAVIHDLDLAGPGPAELTISGNHASRVLAISGGCAVEISGLTIADGHAIGPNTGAGESYGGGIASRGTLTLDRCWLIGNQADEYGGGIYTTSYRGGELTIISSILHSNSARVGGAVCNSGKTDVLGSTIFGNKAETGGGIWCVFGGSSTTLRNSTLSGNTATGTAGGIGNASGSTVTIENSTICSNTAGTSGGGIARGGDYDDAFSIRNSIVADNNAPIGPDVAGSQNLVSQDYNLIENISGGSIIGQTAHNIYGVDPMLGPLADLGGPTPTHALHIESPAVDAGHGGGLATEQRGVPRPLDAAGVANAEGGDGSDIGAYEVDPGMYVFDFSKTATSASLGFNSVLGLAYRLEASEDLDGSWTTLLDGIPGTGADIHVFDTGAAGLPRRYYRFASGPDPSPLLSAWWPFTADALDSSGNGNHGTAANALFVEDRHGAAAAALDFNGADSCVTVPAAPSINMGNGTSISLWIKARPLPAGVQTLVCKADYDTLVTNYAVRLLPGGDIQWEFGGLNESTSQPIQAGGWHHIVVVAGSAVDGKCLYVDGLTVATTGKASTTVHGTVSKPLSIGCALNGSEPWSEHFDGTIDDVRIYNRALTPTEVTMLYLQEK